MIRVSIRLPRLALLVLWLAFAALAEDSWSGVERIVAIGDVHGDYDQFVTLLQQTGLIDDDAKWVGGRTHLVQTGDVPDRGPDTRKILELLQDLEDQSRKSDGYVHSLVGNHEAMNVYGDLRYVHPGEFESFKTGSSRRLLERAFESEWEDLRRDPPPEGLPEYETFRTKWFADHPPGYVEHRRAFGPDGEYGKWITDHNVVIKINDTLFLHGGIGPKYAGRSIEEMNKEAGRAFDDFSRVPGGVLVHPEGPLWYRGLAENEGAREAEHLQRLLTKHDVKRIVIGHTPTTGAVMPRFDGKVVLIDVGLSAAYGGRLACLILENGKAYAMHRGEKIELPTDASDLLEYLEKCAALDPQPSPLAATIAKLRRQQ